MPQLDTASYLPQVFWLTLIFTFFYLAVNNNILPTISQPLKAREKKLIFGRNLLITLEEKNKGLGKNFSSILSKCCSISSLSLDTKFSQLTNWREQTFSTENVNFKVIDNMNNCYLKEITKLHSLKNSIILSMKNLETKAKKALSV